MKFAYALIVAGLLCSSAATAQDISMIVYQPVLVPARIVFVPRVGPIRRALWGPYQLVVIPKVEKEQAAK